MNRTLGIALSLLTLLGGSAVAFAQEGGPMDSAANNDPGCVAKRDTFRSKMLARYDQNGNGTLDDGERAKMRADFQEKRQEKRQEKLARFDVNKDGVLDPSEKAAMRTERAEHVLARLDVNKDGVLSIDEVKCSPLARNFEKIDTDRSGTISEAELVAAGPLFHHHHHA
ncbi:MAG: hypothetical protein ABI321_00195 [Polyangia bacterium]